MDKKKVGVGVASTSWWADAMYLPALQYHPQAKVIAVCGRDSARTQAFAKKWGIPHYFTDFNEMVESGLLDAVIIATDNESHYKLTMKALESGLHVLCEKPMAMSISEAEEMIAKAQESGLKCLVPFTYRFMPTARYVKRLIDDGYIGKPYHLNMRYYTGYARKGQYMWRFDMEKAGSGPIGDIGSHFIYLAMWYYGEIESVMCQLGQFIDRAPRPDGNNDYERTDDGGSILLQFKNGAQGVIMASAVCYEDSPFGQNHEMEFHGSSGTLYAKIDWDKVQEVRGARDGEGMIKPLPIPEDIWGTARRESVGNTYKDMFREHDFMARGLIRAIVEDTEAEPGFAEALHVQRVLHACQRSAKENRRVWIESK